MYSVSCFNFGVLEFCLGAKPSNLKNITKMVTFPPPGKISADAHESDACKGHDYQPWSLSVWFMLVNYLSNQGVGLNQKSSLLVLLGK